MGIGEPPHRVAWPTIGSQDNMSLMVTRSAKRGPEVENGPPDFRLYRVISRAMAGTHPAPLQRGGDR